jgi:hypothetical protein
MKREQSNEWALLLTLSVVACAAADDQTELSAGSVEETVVQLHADGSETVSTRVLSAEEAAAEIALRERLSAAPSEELGELQQPLTRDVRCGPTSIWLNDQTEQRGSRICFFSDGVSVGVKGEDFAHLDSYCRIRDASLFGTPGAGRCLATWAGAVRSYWGGVSDATLIRFSPAPGYCTVSVSPLQRVDSADECAQASELISYP